MNEYFIHDGQTQQGPFTLSELKAKHLSTETLVWYDGLAEWTTIKNIPELIEQTAARRKPPPLANPTVRKDLDFENANQTAYRTAMEEYFPTKERKSPKITILIVAGLITAAIIIWLVSNTNQHNEAMATLQQQVSDRNETEEQNRMIEQQKNLTYRLNWDRYIKAQHEEPKVDFVLGGIGEFNVHVTNETEYTLDQVDVYVQYIRKSGEIWQAKTLRFFNVTPNSVESQIAPSSVNGIRVSVEIQKIICKKMQFCYPAYTGKENDPYFCK